MDQQVTVRAEPGSTLTSVTVTSDQGRPVAGELATSGGGWHSTGPLTAATRYTVTSVTAGQGSQGLTTTSTFTTLDPPVTARLTLNVGDGQTVGVGMPIVLQFNRPVKNKDAALKTLTVTTTPAVDGAWRWINDQSVWWRPEEFWPSGTRVHVQAAIDAAELAPGVWGQRTYTSDFSIGSAIISTVDVAKHTLTVTKDGALVRVIPVTAGKSTPDGKFLTRSGIKVIIEKAESTRMNASTTGTVKDDPEFYDVIEHWTMRLTWSGEYLHARPGSEGAFGKANISHGCTGMSTENAKWLFTFSKVGDVVIYKNSPRPLEWGNGYTPWQMDYDTWASGTS
jgi:lipoprotein-anchoring transpeptidase ErfK/SrfK